NGKNSLAVMIGLNLPLYRRRIHAGVNEARQSLASSRQSLQQVRDRLRYEIQEAVLRLKSREERARLYRSVLIPQAEESLASAEAAYTTSQEDFLDLLDAERILFQVRLTHKR
ncbi:MAG: TolC family protein, partial [Acidobacteriota bacterium]